MAEQKSHGLAWAAWGLQGSQRRACFKGKKKLLTLPFRRLSRCRPRSRRKTLGVLGPLSSSNVAMATRQSQRLKQGRERQSILSLHHINISAATAVHASKAKTPTCRKDWMPGRFEEISIALAVVRKGIYIETLTENSNTFWWCISPTEAQKCDARHCVPVTYRDIGRSCKTEATFSSIFSRRLPCYLLGLY